METFAKLSPMKIAKFDTGDELDNALYWAANDSMSHDVVRLILTYKSTQHATLPAGYETWSAIGWAAHRQLPKLLSLLISSSSGTEQIEHTLRSILASPLELVKRLQSREASDQPPLVILWQLITALKRTTEIEEVLKKASEKLDRQTLAQESRNATYFSEVTSGARGSKHQKTGLMGNNTLMSAGEYTVYTKKPVSNQETVGSEVQFDPGIQSIAQGPIRGPI
ncbi:hypothetical protein CCUS01_13271 [Colletotrichum cuscutae]|uniref:Uncharacterized protein n=1 Tax=Colletotrichum cuscutae TaxID=1209917 RepID=A0AAI9YCB7_9PEZI|nr:hypothetical protein CCUS01_13271 [Colletotrichum cuscutae]